MGAIASGIIVINKPTDWTSHDVVAKIRGILKQKRVGHGGTLDPMATGILPVFVGRATRAVEYAVEGEKEYLAGLRLGVETDTQDTTGSILATRPVEHLDRAALEAVLPQFRGPIFQIPPMYSAIKIDGQKLYQLARRGQTVERAPRPVTIHALQVLEQTGPGDYRLRVVCSKGTYIRTLCHDIGQALGCGGTMSALHRTRVAGFTGGIELAQLAQAAAQGRGEALLEPVDLCFAQYPALTVDGVARDQYIYHGAPCPWPGGDRPGTYRVYGPQGEFLMLGGLEQGTLTTMKSFFEPQVLAAKEQ